MTNFQSVQSLARKKSSDRVAEYLTNQAYAIGYTAGFLIACLDDFCNWLWMVIEG